MDFIHCQELIPQYWSDLFCTYITIIFKDLLTWQLTECHLIPGDSSLGIGINIAHICIYTYVCLGVHTQQWSGITLNSVLENCSQQWLGTCGTEDQICASSKQGLCFIFFISLHHFELSSWLHGTFSKLHGHLLNINRFEKNKFGWYQI